MKRREVSNSLKLFGKSASFDSSPNLALGLALSSLVVYFVDRIGDLRPAAVVYKQRFCPEATMTFFPGLDLAKRDVCLSDRSTRGVVFMRCFPAASCSVVWKCFKVDRWK